MGGKSHGSVNRMFTLTDYYFAEHIIIRSDKRQSGRTTATTPAVTDRFDSSLYNQCSSNEATSLYILTARDSKHSAMMNVPIQLTTLATAIAFGRGPCRNSSAPIIIGIGPVPRTAHEC